MEFMRPLLLRCLSVILMFCTQIPTIKKCDIDRQFLFDSYLVIFVYNDEPAKGGLLSLFAVTNNIAGWGVFP